jgi:hypothetical protein
MRLVVSRIDAPNFKWYLEMQSPRFDVTMQALVEPGFYDQTYSINVDLNDRFAASSNRKMRFRDLAGKVCVARQLKSGNEWIHIDLVQFGGRLSLIEKIRFFKKHRYIRHDSYDVIRQVDFDQIVRIENYQDRLLELLSIFVDTLADVSEELELNRDAIPLIHSDLEQVIRSLK